MTAIPPLPAWLDRLARTPPEAFEAAQDPRILSALIWDAHHRLGHALSMADLARRTPAGDAGFAAAIAYRLLGLLPGAIDPAGLETYFTATLTELARFSKPAHWLHDEEGREEFVRLLLRDLGLRLPGETPERAADRLQSVSLLERRRLIAASRAAEERARQIREALAAQAAREAADKYQRE